MITLKDIGNIANIKYFAKFYQASIVELELQSQFRCNGSDSYLDFMIHFYITKEETINFTLIFKY